MAIRGSTSNAQNAPQRWLSITGEELLLDNSSPPLGRCLSADTFERLNQLGEGTYGVVYRARNRVTSQIVALKQVRMSPEERYNGIPITALREISILRSLKHPNIVNVLDVAVEEKVWDEIYMVMEYAEQDMANLMDELHVKFSISQVKCLFRQVLEGMEYLHRNDIIHRDIKMQNLLLTAKGFIKIADFGMAREYSQRPLTPGVITIWYRSPEVLLGTKYYTPSVDIWSAGLVLSELLLSAPCLTGETPIEQLSLIVKLLGSPTHDDMAALSSMGCPELIRWQRNSLTAGRPDNLERRFRSETSIETVKYLGGLLKWDPRARWTAIEALGKGNSRCAEAAEKWWRESPRAIEKELLPTFPEVRNGIVVGLTQHGQEESTRSSGFLENNKEPSNTEKDHGYVFDFDGQSTLQRPAKRHRGL